VTARLVAVVACMLVAGCSATPFQRGLLYSEQGKYTRALAAFDEAVRTSPSAGAYANRGATRARLGDTRGAIEDFNEALAREPDDAAVLVNRGNAHVLLGEFKEAIADFSRVLELQPKFVGVWFNRGLARSQAGDPDGARRDWDQAMTLTGDPAVREAMERRAADLMKQAARAAPTASSPDSGTLAHRALDRELAGDHAGALADLKSALSAEQDPDRRAGLEGLMRLLGDSP